MPEQATNDSLISYLNRLYAEAFEAKKKVSQKWDKYLDFFRGNQWPSTKRPTYKLDFVANFFSLAIERNRALLTDTNPICKVVARRRPELKPAAEILTKICEAIWYDDSFSDTLGRVITFSELFGGGVVNVAYDVNREEITLPVMDSRAVYIDPHFKDSSRLDDAEYIIMEDIYPISYLMTRYENAKYLTPDSDVSTYVQKRQASNLILPAVYRRDQTQPSAIPRSRTYEYWIKDRSYNTDSEDVEIGTKKWVKPGERLYPTCRHIIKAKNIILVDERCPYWDGNFPIEMYNWRIDIENIWGMGEAQTLIPPQEFLNKIMSLFLENAIKINNVIWIGDKDALDPKDWDELVDAPGAIVKKNPGRELRRDAPPAMPPHYLEIVNQLKEFIKNLSGETDITRGERSGKLTSGDAVESMQTAAQTLIRERSRSMESFLVRVFQKVISRIFQFYTSDRFFYMFGRDNKLIEFLFKRDELLKAIKGGAIDSNMAFKEFKFTIAPGSSLSLTRVQRGLLASQLFQLGAIDEEALLEMVDFPDRQEVLQRVMARKEQAKAEAYQMSQAPQKVPSLKLYHGKTFSEQGKSKPRSPSGEFS